MYTPFDFNEAVGHRKDYIEERLREGSPVVGLSYDGGVLLLTIRRTQRKVYEIYDRHMFSAIGNQSDVENVRLASIQRAHQEGFERSPDDVTLQRLVGFELSPAVKRAFGDQMVVPFVLRALFAQVGRTPETDQLFTLNYDGEFRQHIGQAVLAGSQAAEDKMLDRLGQPDMSVGREEALRRAMAAWIAGARESLRRGKIGQRDDDEDGGFDPLRDTGEDEPDTAFLRDELKTGEIEVGVLERRTPRESRFRLLSSTDLADLRRTYDLT